VIKRHFLDVLKWASQCSDNDFFNGKGKTALAVGCGYGYEVGLLSSFGYDAYGIDISKFGVKKAKRSHLETDFTICDVQKGLPFKDGVFDLLTCFGVLEHLNYPVRALKAMSAVCKDTIVCTSPNRLVEKSLKQLTRDVDETHINVKSKQEWEKAISMIPEKSLMKIEPFFDASLRVSGKLLFFKSFKVPYFGLDFRILIRKV
jgi:SAM-dependent methyltransferase